MATTSAENYQLKWHSHLTNLNTSFSTLYRSEKFADVMLLSANPDGGGIPAHKVILSSCSDYFANIFENNPQITNAILYIVLPPELSRRSINILVQYMYSGEATVSNDILNEVLRGGELLKIHGLWRNHASDGSASNSSSFNDNPNSQLTNVTNSSNTISNGGTNGSGMLKEKSVIEHSSKIYQKDRSSTELFEREPVLSASRSVNTIPILQENNTKIPKDSPVIVMLSSLQNQLPSTSTSIVQNHTNTKNQSTSGNNSSHQPTLIIKKDVAIDPGDSNHVPPAHYELVSVQMAAAVKKAQEQQHQLTSKSNSNSGSNGFNDTRVRTLSENCLAKIHVSNNNSYTKSNNNNNHLDSGYGPQLKDIRIPDKKKLSTITAIQQNHIPSISPPIPLTSTQTTKQSTKQIDIPEALNFLTIKEEPVEWLDYNMGERNGSNPILTTPSDKKHNIEISVKPELLFSDENLSCSGIGDGVDDNDDNSMASLSNADQIYSPLTCELCSATFTIPGEWVRHIENHGDSSHTIPKKRRRTDENSSENIVSLRCDLCNMVFATPGEWVRHVQNIHTETELAISNNSSLPKRVRPQRPNEGSSFDKTCSICNKNFPSNASMVIHKRTHTGERPFYCKTCNKGFNVKSNLLRHMRTLHNQILLASTCNDNGGDDSNPE